MTLDVSSSVCCLLLCWIIAVPLKIFVITAKACLLSHQRILEYPLGFHRKHVGGGDVTPVCCFETKVEWPFGSFG